MALGGALAGVLVAIGFGVQGIAANSFAAMWQSYLGNVVAGSSFAFFQSLGMKGILLMIFGLGSFSTILAS